MKSAAQPTNIRAHRLHVKKFNWRHRISTFLVAGGLVSAGLSAFLVVGITTPVSAACAGLPSDKGVATTSVSVSEAGTYRVWSRVQVPDTSNNSYYLEIGDTLCGVVVGDSGIAANQWTWVDYRDGNSSNKISVNLSAGSHTIRMVGREDGVKLDRIILTKDTACVPTGTGDNCLTQPDPDFSCAGRTADICETFDGAVSSFATTGGTWAVAGGTYNLTNPANDGTPGNANIAVHNTALTGDITVEARAKVTGTANAFDDFSVIFDYTDVNNYSFVSFNESNDDNTNGIFRVTDGTATQVADFAATIVADTFYQIKIQRTGNEVSVWRDGGLQGTATVNATGGKVGFGSKNNAASFDNLLASGTASNPGTKAGDVNGDNAVNATDLTTLLSNYGRTGMARADGDVTGDGIINGLDLSTVITGYGS